MWGLQLDGNYSIIALSNNFLKKNSLKVCRYKKKPYLCTRKTKGSLAQLNRAFDYGSKGYRFESYRSHFLQGRVAQLNRVADYGSAGYRFESCRDH